MALAGVPVSFCPTLTLSSPRSLPRREGAARGSRTDSRDSWDSLSQADRAPRIPCLGQSFPMASRALQDPPGAVGTEEGCAPSGQGVVLGHPGVMQGP